MSDNSTALNERISKSKACLNESLSKSHHAATNEALKTLLHLHKMPYLPPVLILSSRNYEIVSYPAHGFLDAISVATYDRSFTQDMRNFLFGNIDGLSVLQRITMQKILGCCTSWTSIVNSPMFEALTLPGCCFSLKSSCYSQLRMCYDNFAHPQRRHDTSMSLFSDQHVSDEEESDDD